MERLLTRDQEETIKTTTLILKMVLIAPLTVNPLTKDPQEETTILSKTLKVKATNKDPEETTTRTITPVDTITEEDLTKIKLKMKLSEIY